MGLPKSEHPVPPMSVDAAADYVDRMVRRERASAENNEAALRQIATRYRIGFWQLHHLFKRKAKTCDSALFGRIRDAYLDHCAKQITALQLELAVDKAVNPDAETENLAAQAAELAAKIAEKRAKRRA